MSTTDSTKMNAVGWFEIYVNDLQRAINFYQTVFGTTLELMPNKTDEMEMWAFPYHDNAEGAPGALVKMNGVNAGGSGTLVYFSCEDCEVVQQRVEAAGGKIQQAKWSIGENGFIALIADTEGNMIGLHSFK